MPTLPPIRRTMMPEAMRPRPRERRPVEDRRGSAASRGYDSRWAKARETFIKRQPLCVCCRANGVIAEAEIVDHIIPHKGDPAVFWRTEDWQSLCNRCHEQVKKPIEHLWLAGKVDAGQLRLARRMPEHFG